MTDDDDFIDALTDGYSRTVEVTSPAKDREDALADEVAAEKVAHQRTRNAVLWWVKRTDAHGDIFDLAPSQTGFTPRCVPCGGVGPTMGAGDPRTITHGVGCLAGPLIAAIYLGWDDGFTSEGATDDDDEGGIHEDA